MVDGRDFLVDDSARQESKLDVPVSRAIAHSNVTQIGQTCVINNIFND